MLQMKKKELQMLLLLLPLPTVVVVVVVVVITAGDGDSVVGGDADGNVVDVVAGVVDRKSVASEEYQRDAGAQGCSARDLKVSVALGQALS